MPFCFYQPLTLSLVLIYNTSSKPNSMVLIPTLTHSNFSQCLVIWYLILNGSLEIPHTLAENPKKRKACHKKSIILPISKATLRGKEVVKDNKVT